VKATATLVREAAIAMRIRAAKSAITVI
jgi:hypothetical protein